MRDRNLHFHHVCSILANRTAAHADNLCVLKRESIEAVEANQGRCAC